jgi:uncharacterized protein
MIIDKLAHELQVNAQQVKAAVTLLDEGSTVPFIARYRKEATQGLDDIALRKLEQRLRYLRELEDRKKVIIKSIQEQDKLTSELQKSIINTENKTDLEDLYLPFKPKRRTKGQVAKEAGLEPLASDLLNNPSLNPEAHAQSFIKGDISDTKQALEGAKFILMERFAEDPQLLQKIRKHLTRHAHIQSRVIKGKEKEAVKYKDYFEHSERLTNVPSHRALAMFRGRNEGVLSVRLEADPEQAEDNKQSHCEYMIAQHLDLSFSKRAADPWLQSVVQSTWRNKIMSHMENELFGGLRDTAEAAAIDVFANNLKDLLMAAPAGPKVTMGLDPGLRTGVKIAIVDATGKILATSTIFPHVPQNQWEKSSRTIANLCKQHKVQLISIGNGTGSRETDKLVSETLSKHPELGAKKLVVSEAGASVYSASELASAELPDLDVSLRGAVSIARRLQDPLAELVKIEPKAIGVGQYQHDVSQSRLGQSLNTVIEDCVNSVGVDLNTASGALLSHVSGLNKTLAHNIVAFRDTHGAFENRKQLIKVERLGPKAFEQSAGFLRVTGGSDPLDNSAVHPEAYPVVKSIVQQANVEVSDLLGNAEVLKQLRPEEFVTDKFGLPTITDILNELDKPGRDPRPEFKMANFNEQIQTIADLKVGMILEGVVSNVANFGAFVDVGVHQDGLVHISAMTDKFISDPRDIVKAGEIVKVKVMEVDAPRKRISFSMKLSDSPSSHVPKASAKVHHSKSKKTTDQGRKNQKQPNNQLMGNAFAEAFAKAKK